MLPAYRTDRLCFLVGILAILFSDAALAIVPKPENPELVSFDSLALRIRETAAGESWKEAQWKDDVIEGTLRELVDSIKKQTGKDFLKLPVQFTDEGRGLQVLKGDSELNHIKKSIILVDGSVHVSFVSDSIIIARGIVEIAHGNRNLILSGQHVDISHDGNDCFGDGVRLGQVDKPMRHGSIVVTGGSIEISHAQGTICSGMGRIAISHASQVDFLGVTNRAIAHERGCKEHKGFRVPLLIGAARVFPASVLKLNEISRKKFVTIAGKNIEYVLRTGAPLVDETGKPIPEWENWKVGFISDSAALFTDGKSDFIATVKE